jgi:hypothetical protein
MRWAGHVARIREGRGPYRVSVGMHEGKMPLGRTRRRWGNNSKIKLRVIFIDEANWIRLTQGRVCGRAFENKVMKLRFP